MKRALGAGALLVLQACGSGNAPPCPPSDSGAPEVAARMLDASESRLDASAGDSPNDTRDARDAASDVPMQDGTESLDTGTVAQDAATDALPDVDLQSVFNVFPQGQGPVLYNGGPVLLGTVPVYLLWYGDWSASTAPAVLERMLHDVGGDDYTSPSSYDGILQAYCDGDGGRPSGRFQFAGSYYLGYPAGNYLGLGNNTNVVADAITYGNVPYDATGVYALLTSADVTQDLGTTYSFCGSYCAYHSSGHTNSADQRPFEHIFIGDPTQCLDKCTMRPEYLQVGADASPHGDWAVDAMTSLLMHELFESVSDPIPYSAWVNPFSEQEIGDLCGWRFDPVYRTDAGSIANVNWGGSDYLIQQLWVLDDGGGHCGLAP